jgi:hypothetical protein
MLARAVNSRSCFTALGFAHLVEVGVLALFSSLEEGYITLKLEAHCIFKCMELLGLMVSMLLAGCITASTVDVDQPKHCKSYRSRSFGC